MFVKLSASTSETSISYHTADCSKYLKNVLETQDHDAKTGHFTQVLLPVFSARYTMYVNHWRCMSLD
jgi:hypothetical protein